MRAGVRWLQTLAHPAQNPDTGRVPKGRVGKVCLFFMTLPSPGPEQPSFPLKMTIFGALI